MELQYLSRFKVSELYYVHSPLEDLFPAIQLPEIGICASLRDQIRGEEHQKILNTVLNDVQGTVFLRRNAKFRLAHRQYHHECINTALSHV